MPKWLTNIAFSFPVRLLILHFRSNLLLITLWIFLVLLISGALGRELGFLYLFLEPEYLNEVNFWSFFVVGLAFGGFLMTWNLTTYLLCAHYFPFLASLHHPFTKFCLNNLIIPITFLIFYLVDIIRFQFSYDYWTLENIFYHTIGLITGMLSLLIFYFLYFYYTNQDISSFEDKEEPEELEEQNIISPGRRKVDLEYIKMDANRQRVDYYFAESLRARRVRSVAHYDVSMMKRIFRQNHLNALVIQLITIFVLFTLGSLMDFALFRIPAGASLFIFVSVITAIVGAITYWFDEWRNSVNILILIAINFFTSFKTLNHTNKAYGLNYTTEAAAYNYEKLKAFCASNRIEKDKEATIEILEKWKEKNTGNATTRPKMIFIGVTGGGLRSASWTVKVMQHLDSLTQGQLLDQTVLMTGASGGMLGLSYMRELHLRRQLKQRVDFYSDEHFENISTDLLNSLAFTMVSNDLFLPLTQFKVGEHLYRKDRGYILEQQFNENTDNILDKPISAYREAEREGMIPMMFLTPSIVNDARRLIISAQPVSYMMIAPLGIEYPDLVEVDAVDFGWLFEEQEADSLLFTSALRMSATFPYILPNVHLPSQPEIEAVDAGFLDNYGLLSAARFIQVFRGWIEENTGGIIFLQITSSSQYTDIAPSENKGAIETIFNPIGIAGQIFSLQEYEQDNSLGFIYDLLGEENFNFVQFTFDPGEDDKIKASISFHLTAQEKKMIEEEINTPFNRSQAGQLLKLLEE